MGTLIERLRYFNSLTNNYPEKSNLQRIKITKNEVIPGKKSFIDRVPCVKSRIIAYHNFCPLLKSN